MTWPDGATARTCWRWPSAGCWIRDQRSPCGALGAPASWRRSGKSLVGTSTTTHAATSIRSEEHTSELQSLAYLVCRLLLEKKKTYKAVLNHKQISRAHIRRRLTSISHI